MSNKWKLGTRSIHSTNAKQPEANQVADEICQPEDEIINPLVKLAMKLNAAFELPFDVSVINKTEQIAQQNNLALDSQSQGAQLNHQVALGDKFKVTTREYKILACPRDEKEYVMLTENPMVKSKLIKLVDDFFGGKKEYRVWVRSCTNYQTAKCITVNKQQAMSLKKMSFLINNKANEYQGEHLL